MSQETIKDLNTNVLVGNGRTPWHFSKEHQGEESTLYPGFIPVEDALRRVFNFEVNSQPVFTKNAAGELFEVPEFLAQVPTDRNICYGIHSKSYVGHQYNEWLINYVAKLLDGHTVGLGTVGKVKDGAEAWAQIEVPEVFKTIQGIDFRSFLLAATSFNAKIPTIYKCCEEVVVCENTCERGLGESGLEFRIKHTANSISKLETARDALHLIEREQEAFAEEIKTLCEFEVTELQFQQFLAQLVPLPEVKPRDINVRDYSTRSATIAKQKREKLNELYRSDGRIAPWRGTAFGVRQLINTFNQHENRVKKDADRFLRNTSNLISGKTAQDDNNALELLLKITDKQLVAA